MLVAGEDGLSVAVVIRLLVDAGHEPCDLIAINTSGKEKLFAKMPSLIRSAHGGIRVLVCADLDRDECPVALKRRWYPNGLPDTMIFAAAVREVDAWLLADPGLWGHLGCANHRLDNPEDIDDPKEALINFACRSRLRSIRDELARRDGALTRVGPGYNFVLQDFVQTKWNHVAAAEFAPSLARLKNKIRMV